MPGRRGQRGVVLIIALVMLITITFAGIALFRQVGLGAVIVGNLAFKQGATAAADRGIESARTWLTTPSLALGGRGATGVNASVAGLDMDGDGTTDDFLAADYRDHLAVRYRTPLSVAAGVTFKIQKVRAYASAEWFGRVRPYTVLDAPEFVSQTSGETLSTDVTQELKSVCNWGLGLEWFYSARFKGYASFNTDVSAKRAGTATNLSLTDWNIQHIVTGAEFTYKKTSFTVGLGFSFGGREIDSRPDIVDREGLEGMWNPFHELRFRYRSYKLIVGFAI